MQIVYLGDNLHETSNPIFLDKIRKNIAYVSSVKLAQRVIKVKAVCVNKF